MPKFSVNPHRRDPYRNFKFKIMWDSKYVAGLSKCSALKRSTEVVDWHESADPLPYKLPGKTKYEAITLEAGVTHDTAFEEWANKVYDYSKDGIMGLKDFRKDVVIIDVFNLQDQTNPVIRYNVYRCWVSDYQALPELDANGNAVMIQTIKLENEGWERDTSVAERAET
jgi:phage tail-like protein